MHSQHLLRDGSAGRMTDDLTMATIEGGENWSTPSKRPAGWWKRAWRAFVNYFDQTTKRKTVALGALFAAIGFQLVIHQLDHLSSNARRSDNYAAALAVYQTQVVSYGESVANHQLCIDGITRSDANRGQWLVAIQQLRNANLEAAAEALEQGPLLAAAPRDASQCPAIEATPTPPTR